MKWHDLLYFSKGERRALTFLLSLIAAAWLTLLWAPDLPQESEGERASYRQNHDISPDRTPALPVTPTPPATAGSSFDERRKSHRKIPRASQPGSPSAPAPEKASRKTPASHFPPAPAKFPKGTIIELNAADTLILKKVPGIGSSFARRIVKYRSLLGGFYTVEQLSEVYGIDEDRYRRLAPWFRTDASLIRPIRINGLPADSLPYHPYLNKSQKRVLRQLRRQKGRIESWENLYLLEEFTPADRERLAHYLSFK